MPTNYQAQVKTSKTTPNRVARDSVAVLPSLNADAPVKPPLPGRTTGPHTVIEFPPGSTHGTALVKPESKAPRLEQARHSMMAYAFFKRLFDLVVGSILFLIALPIILIAAAAIRINTPG